MYSRVTVGICCRPKQAVKVCISVEQDNPSLQTAGGAVELTRKKNNAADVFFSFFFKFHQLVCLLAK